MISHFSHKNVGCKKKVLQKLQDFINEKDRFTLLLVCLRAIFPHLGAPPLDLVDGVNNMMIKKGDALDILYASMTRVHRRFEVSKQIHSSACLIQRFIKFFMQMEDLSVRMSILTIYQKNSIYLLTKDADKLFSMNISDIYDYLQTCQIEGSYKFEEVYLHLYQRCPLQLLRVCLLKMQRMDRKYIIYD